MENKSHLSEKRSVESTLLPRSFLVSKSPGDTKKWLKRDGALVGGGDRSSAKEMCTRRKTGFFIPSKQAFGGFPMGLVGSGALASDCETANPYSWKAPWCFVMAAPGRGDRHAAAEGRVSESRQHGPCSWPQPLTPGGSRCGTTPGSHKQPTPSMHFPAHASLSPTQHPTLSRPGHRAEPAQWAAGFALWVQIFPWVRADGSES